MLEKKIERGVCDYAKKKGFLTPKINVVGERGWPDRLFIDPEGWHIYVEFKAPGKSLAPIQQFRIGQLAARGLMTLVIDNEEEGKKYVDDMVTARLSEESDGTTPRTGERRAILRSGAG